MVNYSCVVCEQTSSTKKDFRNVNEPALQNALQEAMDDIGKDWKPEGLLCGTCHACVKVNYKRKGSVDLRKRIDAKIKKTPRFIPSFRNRVQNAQVNCYSFANLNW